MLLTDCLGVFVSDLVKNLDLIAWALLGKDQC